jgi:hypothetical protein
LLGGWTYGGVELPALLLYARERLGDKQLEKEVLKILKRLWRNHQQRLKRKRVRDRITHSDFVYQGLFGWPGAIVPFLLEQIEIEDFERAAGNTTSERLKERRQCQADFYIALRALREKNDEVFQLAMIRCANSQRGALEQEYYLALWELERGFPREPFIPQNSG